MSTTATNPTTPDWLWQPTAGHETHGQCAVYSERDGKTICSVHDSTFAPLISAAPALLEALRRVESLRRRWREEDTFSSIDYMDGLDSIDLASVMAKAEQ